MKLNFNISKVAYSVSDKLRTHKDDTMSVLIRRRYQVIFILLHSAAVGKVVSHLGDRCARQSHDC